MALRQPCAAARVCTPKKVCLTVLAAATVSGVWPLAAKARSSVAELRKQLTTAEQQAQEASKRAESAEQQAKAAQQQADAAQQQAKAAQQQADAAQQQAKMRVWVGTALSYLMLIVVAGIVTGIVPRIISSKLPPSVAEVIKQALYR